ncbi:MAG: geranylgeranylglyceryl/heptaprenylglyceryl phosphate synthase [Candidatus Marinimicrobia bacterium]|nr:geranylgeranylglyceryl/heptaprenylglyceryl phosphate synthase [Candidatus Neomarinimicrobiota bacterium]
MTVFGDLLAKQPAQRANYLVLIDPDSKNDGHLPDLVAGVNEAGADAILVGGSLIMDGGFIDRVKAIKDASNVPVILFPGASSQINPHLDAVLFMSLLSGRNPQFLIGEQVQAAPVVKHLGLEAISTGYLLLDGGGQTAVEFMSGSLPLPMGKPDLVVAHALAAQYLGMQLIYLEAGSGASRHVPVEVIKEVNNYVDIPLMVGGGIREPETAARLVEAGARFIVTGTVIETADGPDRMAAFARAVHGH